jgi:hypothetical protein
MAIQLTRDTQISQQAAAVTTGASINQNILFTRIIVASSY